MRRNADLETRAGLLDRWHRQVSNRLEEELTVRPLAFVKWSVRAPLASSLINIRYVRVLVLYDEAVANTVRIRFAGYWLNVGDEGLKIGGVEGHRFDKQLSLAPRCGARGARIDASDILMLRNALLFDDRLSAATNDGSIRPKRLRLPSLWAGFTPAVAATVQGSGPELFGECHRRGESSKELLERFRRSHNGLQLLPFEWCGGYWPQAQAVFADFGGIPRCQILDCSGGFGELQGYRAACEFDFLANRFASRRRSRSSRPRTLTAAR